MLPREICKFRGSEMQPPVFSWEWFFSEIKTYQEYLFFFHFLSLIDFALHQQWNYYFNCRKAKCWALGTRCSTCRQKSWLNISKSCKGIEWRTGYVTCMISEYSMAHKFCSHRQQTPPGNTYPHSLSTLLHRHFTVTAFINRQFHKIYI